MDRHRTTPVPLTIRPYRPADRDAVRTICRETAFRNRGSDIFFPDGELIADYWTGYYLRYEADSCLVAEKGGRVVGYLLGCPDSLRFVRLFKRAVLPVILFKLLGRFFTLRYRTPQAYRCLRWLLWRSWREVPRVPMDRFSAHYHANVLREASFQNGFTGLVERFLNELDARGIYGIYGIVPEPVAGGWFSKLVAKAGEVGLKPEFLQSFDTSMYRDVMGSDTPMVHRVFAASVANYREFLHFIRERYHL